MKTRLILKPGQRGTKNLVEKYGEALLCVRFRYDAELRQRLKTIELIVEKTEWTPPQPRYNAETLVPLRIAAEDIPMRAQVKAGGRWNPEKRRWFVKSLRAGEPGVRNRPASRRLNCRVYTDPDYAMAQKTISSRNIKGIIIQRAIHGNGATLIARSLKIAKSTVHAYIKMYDNSDLVHKDILNLSANDIAAAIRPQKKIYENTRHALLNDRLLQ